MKTNKKWNLDELQKADTGEVSNHLGGRYRQVSL